MNIVVETKTIGINGSIINWLQSIIGIMQISTSFYGFVWFASFSCEWRMHVVSSNPSSFRFSTCFLSRRWWGDALVFGARVNTENHTKSWTKQEPSPFNLGSCNKQRIQAFNKNSLLHSIKAKQTASSIVPAKQYPIFFISFIEGKKQQKEKSPKRKQGNLNLPQLR